MEPKPVTRRRRKSVAATPADAQKQKIALEVSGKALAPEPVTVTPTVVSEKNGKVTVFDEIKKYYKGLIAFVGMLLIIINQVTPWLNDILTDPNDKKLFTVIVSAITALGVILKDNEKWVDKLPD